MGGLEVYAFEYALTSAIELESDYPYKPSIFLNCLANPKKLGVVSVTGYERVPSKSVAQLKAAI